MRFLASTTVVAAFAVWAAATPLLSQEEAPTLPVDQAKEFMGTWDVAMSLGGDEVKLSISFEDEDGFVVVVLDSPQGSQRITDISPLGEGLELRFEAGFGEMSIETRVEAGELLGALKIESAGINADLHGVRAAADVVRASSGSGSLFGRAAPKTRLRIDGKVISIRYPDSASAGPQLAPTQGDSSAEELRFTQSAAIQLRTDLSLQFGDTVIKTGNFSPNYPGVYSLWLQRVDDDWTMVVNEEGDIWGTQHEPEFDVAEIPLQVELVDPAAEKLEWKLERTDNGGVIKVFWQQYALQATFALLEQP